MPKNPSKTANRTIADIEKASEMDKGFTQEVDQEMIEAFANDRTKGLPEEAYEQIDQEIKGFSMGSRAAIKGFKYGGVK